MNSNYKYTLEKYRGSKTRHVCPGCKHKKSLALYVSTETGEPIAEDVGRCNREASCGYHFKPSEYFALFPGQRPAFDHSAFIEPIKKDKVNIPIEIVNKSMVNYEGNTFTNFLLTQFEPRIVGRVIREYKVGTSEGAKWWSKEAGSKSAIFFFINVRNEVRSGQVKLFKPDGHGDKYKDEDGDFRSCTTWVHTLINQAYKRAYKDSPQWLKDYIEYMAYDKATDCFFGEHLLSLPENKNKPVAILEAPKGAIIASVFIPQFVWLAAGSLSYLTADRCSVLTGKDVTLYPDLGAFEKWQARGAELQGIANFTTSDVLERIATDEQRAAGYDLADFLTSEAGRAELIDSLKQTIINENPGTDNEYMAIWLRYCDIGLRRSEFNAALKELANELHFEVYENNDLQPQTKAA